MEAIKEIIKLFENFIKRAVMPSVSFGFIFCVEYLVFYFIERKEVKDIEEFIYQIEYNNLFIISIIILLIGLSYFLSILHQIIFDNNIKENYDGFYSIKENIQLNKLRTNVISKVKKDLTIENITYNDFLLYQTIGRKLKYFSIETRTGRYVDDVKSIGIFFISLCLVNFIFIFIFFKTSFIILGVLVVLFFISLHFGFQMIKSKYRSRAIRMYVNYLIGEKS